RPNGRRKRRKARKAQAPPTRLRARPTRRRNRPAKAKKSRPNRKKANPSNRNLKKRLKENRPNSRANRRGLPKTAASPLAEGPSRQGFHLTVVGCPLAPPQKKHKTFHPYRDGPCAGRGRDTWGLPAKAMRQGRSTALAMPILGPVTISPLQVGSR